VTDVEEFVETLERIVKGGSVMDPHWCGSW
jgi:hypothetical protein